MKSYSLYELNNLVKGVIDGSFTGEYWVQAELSECYEKAGHCYLELVEKGPRGNTFIAKARAIIWADTWSLLKYSFEKTTGQRLAKGMKVLMQVYPNFHEAFGFSWIVTDIDATYTIGDLARKRQEIIRQLQSDGVYDMNKQLSLPLFCQRIAVISSASAAGYGDFSNQLANNPYGFHFETTLFEAVMQGEMVEKTVISALDAIYGRVDDFDCVVIIRGGGASSDLSGFDTYPLAVNVAQFPLPVITGIGHERDDTVLDMVSHTRVKTPTAAAEFLVSQLKEISDFLDYSYNIIRKACDQTIRRTEQQLLLFNNRLGEVVRMIVERKLQRLMMDGAKLNEVVRFATERKRQRLQVNEQRLAESVPLLFERKRHRLELMTQTLKAIDPKVLLKRGYSITTLNGKIMKDAKALSSGDEIETRLKNGKVKSIVK